MDEHGALLWLVGKSFCASTRPVVLLVDGHSTHINIEISKFCKDNQILLYCLPAHSSHITQPLDVGFYGPLKNAWKRAVDRFISENVEQVVNKENFASVFRQAWDDCVKVPTIIHSFKHSGIYPVNYSAIRSSKVSPSIIYTPSPEPSLESPNASCSHTSTAGVTVESPLATLESAMSIATKERFEKRLEEGYDVESDELYNVWSKLKKQLPSINTAVVSPCSSSSDSSVNSSKPMSSTASSLSEILVYPKPTVKKKQNGGGTSTLPTHLSSDQMIQYLEDKENKKLQDEQEKNERKEARERKREEKERKKIEQQKERERIKEERKRKKEERQKEREKKKAVKKKKRKEKEDEKQKKEVEKRACDQIKRVRSKRTSSMTGSLTPKAKLANSYDDSDSDLSSSSDNYVVCPICFTSKGKGWICCDDCCGISAFGYDKFKDMDWVCPSCE